MIQHFYKNAADWFVFSLYSFMNMIMKGQGMRKGKNNLLKQGRNDIDRNSIQID